MLRIFLRIINLILILDKFVIMRLEESNREEQ